jgi:hypothetical protein
VILHECRFAMRRVLGDSHRLTRSSSHVTCAAWSGGGARRLRPHTPPAEPCWTHATNLGVGSGPTLQTWAWARDPRHKPGRRRRAPVWGRGPKRQTWASAKSARFGAGAPNDKPGAAPNDKPGAAAPNDKPGAAGSKVDPL